MVVQSPLPYGAAPPVLRMCFQRPASGRVPDVRSRRAQASTSAQIRTTLTHVHSHSARVFAYTLASICTKTSSLVVTSGLDVLHHRKHTVRRLTACHTHRKGRGHDNDTTGTRARENPESVA